MVKSINRIPANYDCILSYEDLEYLFIHGATDLMTALDRRYVIPRAEVRG